MSSDKQYNYTNKTYMNDGTTHTQGSLRRNTVYPDDKIYQDNVMLSDEGPYYYKNQWSNGNLGSMGNEVMPFPMVPSNDDFFDDGKKPPKKSKRDKFKAKPMQLNMDNTAEFFAT